MCSYRHVSSLRALLKMDNNSPSISREDVPGYQSVERLFVSISSDCRKGEELGEQ
jgi:hypothetical protein